MLAGLPTTNTLTVGARTVVEGLALGAEDATVGLEQIGSLHALLAWHGTHEKCIVAVSESDVGVVGLHHAVEKGKGAVVELHVHTVESTEGRGDLEQLQDHGLVVAEQLTTRDAEQQRIADLTGCAGDGDSHG